jgi:hypothetical protein
MKNLHPVYKCEDYNVNDRVLLIENAQLLGMVQNVDQFNKLIQEEAYNAVVCPGIISLEFDYIKFI